MTAKKTRKCTECGDEFSGRVDKRFCSDQCRNTYNNRNNADCTNHVRNINHILKKNRRILCELNPEGKAKTHRNKLNELGFNFNYFTNILRTQKGTVYYFCYEYGYLMLENDFFFLVKLREKHEAEAA
jgi:predicted nucleic acid-binding Zn ribbon protein